jgi:DHA2 family multidrug resistance protein
MPDASAQSNVNPWLVAAAVILPTFMEVLDTTIVSVSLPHIAGNLSATYNEATWVQTSYLVANAVVLPAGAWFSSFFGRKNFLSACIILFTLASFVCGIASSMEMLIMARVVQGASGGALQPLSQSILLESFPQSKHGQAMAMYGLGVIIAPILGPVLGGWVTDNFSWRWLFFINIPMGILAVLLIKEWVFDPAYVKSARPGRIDAWGFTLLILWLGTLQIVLDKGQDADWFSSAWICWLAAISVCSCLCFVYRELHCEHPITDLRIFGNRNFWVGTLLTGIIAVFLYAPMTLLPSLLQQLMGYSALQSGLAQLSRGVGAAFCMPVVGIIMGRVDVRYLIAFGLVCVSTAFLLLGHLSAIFPQEYLFLPNFIMGVGIGCCMVPLMATSVGLLRKEQMGNATGLFALVRNLAGSIGIALVITLVTRYNQIHQAYLSENLTPYDGRYQLSAHVLDQGLSSSVGSAQGLHAAQGVLYQSMQLQSGLLSYLDVFNQLAMVCIFAIPLVMLLKRVKPGSAASMH